MDVGSKWNEWDVTEFIGEGSFGKVYKIVREEFGYQYESALKVLRIPQNESEVRIAKNDGLSEKSINEYFDSMVKDIKSEFEFMADLRGDSNIVSIEDHQIKKLEDVFGWEIYIRMELLTPLFDYVNEHKMTVRDVIDLGIDMCKAVEACQNYNIIHRDIKPENIFVSRQGHYKLGDFGIARQLERTSSGLSKKGTYSYMAPEVYQGQPYNSTVDIYSLGIVLYRFMNNNRTPFLPAYPETIRYSDKEIANARRMNGEELPAPCNAHGRLAEIILKACSYEMKDRYESALEMRRDLESLPYSEEDSEIIYPAAYMPESSGSSDHGHLSVKSEEGETVALIAARYEEEQEEHTLKDNSPGEETQGEETLIQEENGEGSGDEPDKKPKKLPIFIAGAVLIVLLVCGIFAYIYFHHEVPDLISVDEEKAVQLLDEKGLSYQETGREFSDDIDRGCIISQSIEGGSKVKKGTTVDVVVSKGKAIKVPDLKGKGLKAATKEIEEKGLVIEVEKKKYSDTIPKGSVISQNPDPGSICEQGETVKVVKSRGIEQVKVPDVVGKTQEEAEKAIKNAKLNPSVTTAYSNTVGAGMVMSQSEEAGNKIDKNTTVTITVSVGAAPVYRSSGSGSRRSSGSSGKSKSRRTVTYSHQAG